MSRAPRPVVAGLLGLALVAGTAQAATADSSASTTRSHHPKPTVAATQTLPVSFTVQNVNRSKLTCATDGATYTIRGHITGPADGLSATTASLYLHGLDLGESFWTGAYRGASYVDRQAAAGHVSVTIDRLGYDSSDKPDGFGSCMGGQADIAHQIVEQLKSGSYQSGNGDPTPGAYAEIALHGHSLGGGIAALEAASFGDVDALVVDAYSDRILSPAAQADAVAALERCAQGGESTEGSGAGGYTFFSSSPDDFRKVFFATTPPALIEGALQQRNRNACGDLATVAAIGEANVATAADVHIPVLVVAGGADGVYPAPAGQDTASQFTGSPDVKLVTLAGTGHSLTTEDTAATFSSKVSKWLDRHGLGS